MTWNRTVEIDSTSSVVTETDVEGYLTDFVSRKSSLEGLIDSSYDIRVNTSEMRLEGIYKFCKIFGQEILFLDKDPFLIISEFSKLYQKNYLFAGPI
jgi:hypothetical protein